MRIEVTYIEEADEVSSLERPKRLARRERQKRLRRPMQSRLHIPKSLRHVLVSAVVLLLLLVGMGTAYTYFAGGGMVQPIDTTAASAVSYQPVKPVKVAPNVPVGVAVSSLSTPVSPGSDAFMTVQTLPEATCSISVIYGKGNKVPSKAAGLHSQTADAYGMVNWNWTVDASAPLGTWPVTVKCEHNKHSGVGQSDMDVVSPSSATSAN